MPKRRKSAQKLNVSLVKVLERRMSPQLQQERVLRSLLKRAEQTAFGQHFAFGYLLAAQDVVSAFQRTVPLYTYDQLFADWWHRALAGESNVCWPGRVKYFALSSGTAGATSKYIPITTDIRRSMRTGALRMFACLPKYQVPASLYTKDWLAIGGSAELQPLKTGAFAGDLSGINAKRPPLWIRGYYKPGTRIARLQTWDERVQAISELAPKWDVGIIMGIPSWVQLTLERIIADHNLANIHELWPNLQVFVTGGVAFEPYRRSFEQLLERPLIYQDSYLASEGLIAFQNRPGTHAMHLQLHNGIFYEFVPFNEDNFDEDNQLKPTAEVLTIGEVELGVDYALLISTNAGAWRYLIGDTVRFTDLQRSEIIITGRTKHFLSLCGEHLSIDNMNNAIQQVEQQFQLSIPEFTVGGVGVGSHHAHHWYLGCDEPVPDLPELCVALDKALGQFNDDYGAERSAMLAAPRITIVPVSRFYEWQRRLGKLNGQSKIPRVMRGEKWQEWQAFVDGVRV